MARRHLGEVVNRAIKEGPQVVTRRGREVAVIVAKEEFKRLNAPRPDFKRFLLEAPPFAQPTIERTTARGGFVSFLLHTNVVSEVRKLADPR